MQGNAGGRATAKLRSWLSREAPWVNFTLYVIARGKNDQVLRVAASLSYTSLIALVPLLAIAVAIFAAFPAFSPIRGELESFISQSFVPNAGNSVQVYLRQFINATGKLTTVGVVGLGVTAILTLVTIDTAFNTIFRVARQRPMASRLLMYWAVLTVGPLLLGGVSSVAGSLYTLRHTLAGAAPDGFSAVVAAVMPTLTSWVAFSLLFFFVPHRPVAWRDALIGGAVAAILFALLRFGFGRFVASANTYRTLYGAMAVIPLFLLSMYLSWAVVLFGAVATASLPEWRAHAALRTRGGGAVAELALALDVLALLRQRQQDGGEAKRKHLLAAAAVPEAALESTLEKLRAAGFVARGEDAGWRLARDLGETPMWMLFAALGHGWSTDRAAILPEPWRDTVGDAIEASRRTECDIWSMPVRAVIEAAGKDDTAAA